MRSGWCITDVYVVCLCVAHWLQMLRIRSLNETQRLMVVDDRMRVVYATDTLAKMLSASVSALTEMSLPNLIVPPAAQLHKRWVAVSAATAIVCFLWCCRTLNYFAAALSCWLLTHPRPCLLSESQLVDSDSQHVCWPVFVHTHSKQPQTMAGERPPQGSCRSGAVVCMLAANGARIPVRLEIKTVEHANQDHVQSLHIVKVGV